MLAQKQAGHAISEEEHHHIHRHRHRIVIIIVIMIKQAAHVTEEEQQFMELRQSEDTSVAR